MENQFYGFIEKNTYFWRIFLDHIREKQLRIEILVVIIIVGENFIRLLVNIVVLGKLKQVIIARLNGLASVSFFRSYCLPY